MFPTLCRSHLRTPLRAPLRAVATAPTFSTSTAAAPTLTDDTRCRFALLDTIEEGMTGALTGHHAAWAAASFREVSTTLSMAHSSRPPAAAFLHTQAPGSWSRELSGHQALWASAVFDEVSTTLSGAQNSRPPAAEFLNTAAPTAWTRGLHPAEVAMRQLDLARCDSMDITLDGARKLAGDHSEGADSDDLFLKVAQRGDTIVFAGLSTWAALTVGAPALAGQAALCEAALALFAA